MHALGRAAEKLLSFQLLFGHLKHVASKGVGETPERKQALPNMRNSRFCERYHPTFARTRKYVALIP